MAGFSHSNNKLDSISLEDGAESMAAIAHCCLVRKFIAPKQLNRQAVSSVLQGAWKARASSIAPWNDNLFLFSFDDAEDRRWVQQEGLWFMGYLRTNSPNQMVNGETIGRKIGRLFCVEARCEGLLLYQYFLRIRVEMDITKPLPKGFMLHGGGYWVMTGRAANLSLEKRVVILAMVLNFKRGLCKALAYR
ncbi:hypothetical protein ACSBR1_020548 [Camellia fascicularis]